MRLANALRWFLLSTLTALLLNAMSVREAQTLLKEKGFYNGTVDGVSGPATRKAITEYQKSEGLDASGRLDAQTASRLSSAGAPAATGKPAASSTPPAESKPAAASPPPAATETVTVKGADETKPSAAKKEAGGAVSDAGKAASKEAKSALGEIKGVFGGGKDKDKKKPPAK